MTGVIKQESEAKQQKKTVNTELAAILDKSTRLGPAKERRKKRRNQNNELLQPNQSELLPDIFDRNEMNAHFDLDEVVESELQESENSSSQLEKYIDNAINENLSVNLILPQSNSADSIGDLRSDDLLHDSHTIRHS